MADFRVPLAKRGEPKGGGNCKLRPRDWYKARNTWGRRNHATTRRSKVGNRVCSGKGCCRKRLRRCRQVLGAMEVSCARSRQTRVWASVPSAMRANRSQWMRSRCAGVRACWRCCKCLCVRFSTCAPLRAGGNHRGLPLHNGVSVGADPRVCPSSHVEIISRRHLSDAPP